MEKIACVYQIICNNQSYIGSTVDFLKRMINHRHVAYSSGTIEFNKFSCSPLYQALEKFDPQINILERLPQNVPVKKKKEREQYYINLIKPDLNNIDATSGYCTKEEYQKNYREDNKEKNKVYSKEYRIKNKESLRIYDKEYGAKNKEHRNEKSRQRYQQNTIKCKCGQIVSKKYLSKHCETVKHLNLIIV